jgi:ribosome-binding protein aMBF1 (putative translation factor)
MDDERDDFLDEVAEEQAARNPDFPALVDAALAVRRLLRALATRRAKLGLSQTAVAARMGTSQAAVARLERGEVDPRCSTIGRYATALGAKVEWQVAELSTQEESSARARRA